MESKLLREVTLKNGEKLILRTPVEDDAEALIEYCNQVGGESDNLLFGKNEFHMTVEQEREYIKKLQNNPNSLM
ncbi:MAG TPA: N-acetyltransferase, partial [Mobilitalea sp.]|nr:N-acetyltransferase [Mobilitalea sp.]